MTELIRIDENKQVKSIIKLFENINKIFKNIYCDVVNFNVEYVISIRDNEIQVLYYDKETLPNILVLDCNEDISSLNLVDGDYMVSSKDFFAFLRDYKGFINFIDISEDYITFHANIKEDYEEVFTFMNNDKTKEFKDFFISKINESENLKIDPYHTDYDTFELSENIIKTIYESKNNEMHEIILDFNTNKVIYINDIIDLANYDNYLKIQLNKNFLNNFSYKVKHLKKGDVVDYTPITIDVYDTPRENIYLIELFTKSSFATAKHTFMICDY